MLDVIEISSDVGLGQVSYLLRHDHLTHRPEGVVRVTSWPESIRAFQEIRLEHRFQYPRNRSLQKAVFDRRDGQR